MYLSLIYLFINSTEAFLKFSFITMSNITELSNFFHPLFSIPFWGFWILFFSVPKVKRNYFQEMMFHACLRVNLHIFSGYKHSPTGMKGQEVALFQIFLKLCITGPVSVYTISGLTQIKKVVRLLWLTSHTSAYLPWTWNSHYTGWFPKKGINAVPSSRLTGLDNFSR